MTVCLACLESFGVTTRKGVLTPYGLFIYGAVVGCFCGLFVRAFKALLVLCLHLVWHRLPAALAAAGWTPDSRFSLVHFLWICSSALAALVGLLSVPLLDRVPSPNVGAWAKHVHKSGTVPLALGGTVSSILCLDWVGGFFLLALLSALSGASLGPEPLVVIVPSAIAGAFAAGPLGQGPQVARAAALAGGSAGLAAFFGLPVASAFAVLELPHIDGMQYAMEAMPACLVASLTGALFGNSLFSGSDLLGDSTRNFPGVSARDANEVDGKLGLGALAWGAPAGLLAGIAVHAMVVGIKVLHHPFTKLRRGCPEGGVHSSSASQYWRRVAVLAVAGAVNGGVAVFLPASFFWGEVQLQYALTSGCEAWLADQPAKLPILYPGLLRHALPGHLLAAPCGEDPVSPASMFLLSGVKLLLIALGELSGFVGGAIYPTVFASACFGAAMGSLPSVAALGPQYVFVSSAAAISVGLASLLNTKMFAILFVLVLQASMPLGHTSAEVMVLLFAVSVHYLLSRCLLHKFPGFNMIGSQQHRQDLVFLGSPRTASGSSDAGERTDAATETEDDSSGDDGHADSDIGCAHTDGGTPSACGGIASNGRGFSPAAGSFDCKGRGDDPTDGSDGESCDSVVATSENEFVSVQGARSFVDQNRAGDASGYAQRECRPVG